MFRQIGSKFRPHSSAQANTLASDAVYGLVKDRLASYGIQVPGEVHAFYTANRGDFNAFYTANRQIIDTAVRG